MENHLDLKQWFYKMGYNDPIPESVENICNKSALFIWNELIENVKPKQEVDNVRNNIIIHRLRSKPLTKQDEFPHPIKNIKVYMEKQALEKKLNNLQSIINEKRHTVNNQMKNNKIKYVTVEKLKSRIKENKEREFLLENKCKMFEKSIKTAEETLSFAENLTPVELDDNPNSTEITETLQKCAEKLEKTLKEIPNQPNYNSNSSKKPRCYSVQKESKTQKTFEKYLTMSERKCSEKIMILKHGEMSGRINKKNKENMGGNNKVIKNLFGSGLCEQSKNVDSKRESLGILSEFHVDNGIKTENKRESLGILPESYLDQEFNILSQANVWQEVFTYHPPNIRKIELNVPSPQHNFNESYMLNEHHSKSITGNQKFNVVIFNKLYNDDSVTKKLRNLLYNHNRQIIWNTFRILNDNLHLDITKNIILESGQNKKDKNINREDIAKLQFLHIQTELEIMKLKAVLKDTLASIIKKKKIIYTAINSRGFSSQVVEDIGKQLELQLHDISLDITLAEMKKEINLIKKIEDNNELLVIQGKIAQTKEDIISKIGSIKQYINNVYDILHSTKLTREATMACIRKLRPFVQNLEWSVRLTENLSYAEVKAFEKFPLEYNRRCVYSDPRLYYRDVNDDILVNTDLDADGLYMLTNLIGSPFDPSETIVLHILKNRMKLDALKLLPSHKVCNNYKNYSLLELQAQESYIEYALEKLNSILFSATANKTLGTVERIKSVMEIWLEMPLKEFIPQKRTVEGQDYKFYEKQYDHFYNC